MKFQITHDVSDPIFREVSGTVNDKEFIAFTAYRIHETVIEPEDLTAEEIITIYQSIN